jgi:formylmethanofuran dehydrogenase subunit D
LSKRFALITGRTKEQGQALHLGKESRAYQQATAWIEMSAHDMARLGIQDGQVVRAQTQAGQVELPVRAGVLPDGMVFMPSGPTANKLGGIDTEGTGMPLLKGLTVVIVRTAKQTLSASRPRQAKSRPPGAGRLLGQAKQSAAKPT